MIKMAIDLFDFETAGNIDEYVLSLVYFARDFTNLFSNHGGIGQR